MTNSQICEAFAEVRCEESRREIMTRTHSSINDSEATVSIIRGGQPPLNSRKQRRKRPKCDHCHKLGDTKDRCLDFMADWEIQI